MPILHHGSLVLPLRYYTQCQCNNTVTAGSGDVTYSEQLCSVTSHISYYPLVQGFDLPIQRFTSWMTKKTISLK